MTHREIDKEPGLQFTIGKEEFGLHMELGFALVSKHANVSQIETLW